MTKKYEFEKGDIFIKPFKDLNGKWIKSHPMVVISTSEDGIVTAWDHRAIAAAITMSDINSSHSISLSKIIAESDVIIVNEEHGVKKQSLLQLDTINLFASDILPTDYKGKLDPRIVDQAIANIEILFQKDMVRINKNNLPDVIKTIDNFSKNDDADSNK